MNMIHNFAAVSDGGISTRTAAAVGGGAAVLVLIPPLDTAAKLCIILIVSKIRYISELS